MSEDFGPNFITLTDEDGNEITFEVIAIKNNFFGEKITVSGLITGQDLTEQLSDRKLGDRLLIPCNMLRSGENVFLDDITVTELSEKLDSLPPQAQKRILQMVELMIQQETSDNG